MTTTAGRLWNEAAAAQRYARFRPDSFHGLVVERLRPWVAGRLPLRVAVDLGSGTGQSTRPLLALSQRVIGIEPSAAMRSLAEGGSGITYQEGSGEATGLPDASVDLVSIGLAFHWMDATRAVPEIARILVSGGILAISNNGFVGVMTGQPAFGSWWKDYLSRHPTPKRNQAVLTRELAVQSGLQEIQAETRFEYQESFTADRLAGYLATQTNALEYLKTHDADASTWIAGITASLQPLFPKPEMEFQFQGRLAVWRRSG